DSHNGVRSAAAAGMRTIMVPDLLPAIDEIRLLCRHVAADLHGVRALLDKANGSPSCRTVKGTMQLNGGVAAGSLKKQERYGPA
ncbi:hypothetical protein LTR94_036871, partial [Friedmanniomyces endolithicus]